MKSTLLLIASLSSFAALACPNLSGTFYDASEEKNITIVQNDCLTTVWSDADGETTIIADGVERVVQQEGDNIAYGKAHFTDTEFVLELRAVYSFPVPEDFPKEFITSYRIDKYNNLVEKILSNQGTDYVTFRRVQN